MDGAARSPPHPERPVASARTPAIGEADIGAGEEAIRRFLDDRHAGFERALGRRLGLDGSEATALLHVALAGPLTAVELGLALALPPGEATALAERLVAGGHFVRALENRFGIALPALERLSALRQALDEDLDAVAARLPPVELSIVGRFLDEAARAGERRALDAARRAIEPS